MNAGQVRQLRRELRLRSQRLEEAELGSNVVALEGEQALQLAP
jgi:hypothetical protein